MVASSDEGQEGADGRLLEPPSPDDAEARSAAYFDTLLANSTLQVPGSASGGDGTAQSSLLDDVRRVQSMASTSAFLPLAADAANNIYDALPLIGSRSYVGDHSEPAPFRLAGFGKYRKDNNNQKKRAEDDDEDTDGQYDSGVDADGHGSNAVGKTRCRHRTIENHQCTKCPFKMTKFGSFFDSGKIRNYLRILNVSDSEDCAASLGKELDLIYESYCPTNIIQMRDHVQTTIGRSLVSQLKRKDN